MGVSEVKNKNITLGDMVFYFVATIVGMVAGFAGGGITNEIIYSIKTGGTDEIIANTTTAGEDFFAFCVMNSVFYALALLIMLRKNVRGHYLDSPDRFAWLKSMAIYVIPGEIARMLVCLITFLASKQIFVFIWTNVYFMYGSLYTPIRSQEYRSRLFKDGVTSAADILALLGCYLIVAIVNLALTALVYRLHWKSGKKLYDREYAELHKHDNVI